MDDTMLAVYLREVQRQGLLTLLASDYLAIASRVAFEMTPVAEPVLRNFAAVQGMLTAAAQISKLVTPDRRDEWSDERWEFANARGAAIRKVIKPAPIMNRRAVRNAIEHFDARMDDLFHAHPSAAVIDMNVAPAAELAGATTLRHIDPQTWTVSILGDKVDLRELTDAVYEAMDRAAAWLADHGQESAAMKPPPVPREP